MTRLVQFGNNAVSRLAGNLLIAGTSASLTPGDGSKFPALTGGQYFMGTLVKSDGTTEVVKVTARATDTLTIVRAQEAVAGVTSAYAFSAGDRFEARLTAGMLGGEIDRVETLADTAQTTADTGVANAATAQTTANAALPKAGGTMAGNLEMGAGTAIVFEGATADSFETTLTVTDPTADRTATLPDATGTVALKELAQTFSAAQRGAVVALTDGATITPDFALGNNFSVTLGGSRTLANPTNLTAGQSGAITITQDGTGSRTLAFGSNWKFASGTAPALTTTAAAVDVLAYYVESSSRITARLISDVK